MTDSPNFIEVQKYLGGIDYPCSRDQLVQAAEGNGGGDEVLELLRGLPEREYSAPTEVSEALGSGNGEAS
jgi:hypothetical protein